MKNLNAILSGFNKTLAKLEALSAKNSKAVEENTSRIVSLQEQNLGLIAETQAAKNVAANIRKLIQDEAASE